MTSDPGINTSDFHELISLKGDIRHALTEMGPYQEITGSVHFELPLSMLSERLRLSFISHCPPH